LPTDAIVTIWPSLRDTFSKLPTSTMLSPPVFSISVICIPALNAKAVVDFLDQCLVASADVLSPVVSRNRKFPCVMCKPFKRVPRQKREERYLRLGIPLGSFSVNTLAKDLVDFF